MFDDSARKTENSHKFMIFFSLLYVCRPKLVVSVVYGISFHRFSPTYFVFGSFVPVISSIIVLYATNSIFVVIFDV